jgi:hypothetical protein
VPALKAGSKMVRPSRVVGITLDFSCVGVGLAICQGIRVQSGTTVNPEQVYT